MSNSNCSTWTPDDVSRWLGSLSLHHLVPNFERLQIDGPQLVKLSDQDLRSLLRLTKPAEVMAIRGAINKVVDDAYRLSYHDINRRVSASPRLINAGISRDRPGSFDKKVSRTVPRDLHRNTIATEQLRQPKLVQGSAPELLDKECKYSGWIRKQGGGYKTWKRRYLILRLGCLYYFPNETAATAKGSFVLSGYKTEICTEPEILKKCRYSLKLTPMNPHVRTYYMSVGSERELLGWKEAIDSEIKMVSKRVSLDHTRQPVETMPAFSAISSYDDDDDDDEDDPPYDIPFLGDDDHEYDDPASVIYDKPETASDEEDPYSKIGDGFPQPLGRGLPGKPYVPSRSPYSLQSPTSNITPAAATLQVISDELEESTESTYLPIIGVGSALDPASAQPDLSRTSSPPVNLVAASAPATFLFGQHDDYVDDEYGSGSDDDIGGYVEFRKPEENMPPCCVFDRLERPEADSLLKDKDRDGTYLIRGGSHAGAEKVLSVWHIDRCRHYKLFKDDSSSYSLTQGQAFRTIPELLQFYTNAHLPKSEFFLTDPYNPLDH